jgi:hypothetical protein
LRFLTGHPQIGTHALQKRKFEHIPVLSGTPIPHRDIPTQASQYAIVMIALFRPWNRSASHPLKSDGTSWKDALSALLLSLPEKKVKIIDHMQEQWECRLAADDFSAEYKAQQANFHSSIGTSSQVDDPSDELGNDLDWQLGQLETDDEPIGPEYDIDSPDTDDFAQYMETCTPRTQATTNAIIALAGTANFYHIPNPSNTVASILQGRAIESRDGQAWDRAQAAALLIAEEKAQALDRQAHQGIFPIRLPALFLTL